MASVIAWGTRDHWARAIPDAIDTQLLLAHRLRNDLVETWLTRVSAVSAIWAAYPEVAELEERITDQEGCVEQLVAQAAQQRAQTRSRHTDQAAAAALRSARGELRAARARRREVISRVRGQSTAALAEAYGAERTAVKELYARYCQDGIDGQRLFWATFNDIVAHHRTAVAQVTAAHRQGRPATLRYHRYDGTGSITVQLQRQAGDPTRTPALLRSPTSPWRRVLALADSSRRGTVRLRIAPGPGEQAHATIPVTVHRPLPDDAEVLRARLVVRRTAGYRHAAVHLVVDSPPSGIRLDPSRPTIAIHLGWRRDDEEAGALRVATWRASAPVQIPAAVADIVTGTSDRTGTIRLPANWRGRLLRADQIRSDRDRARDRIQADLVDHLLLHPPTQEQTSCGEWPTAGDVAAWRSPARFAALALRHRDNPLQQRAEIAASLESWRKGDRRLWEVEANLRAKTVRRRDDAYARAAAWLCRDATAVVLDDTDLAELARRRDHDTTNPGGAPGSINPTAGRQRVHAAPGSLRSRIVSTAARADVPVHTVSHRGLTRTHYQCGYVNPPDADYMSRLVRCAGCGQDFDQDGSATLMMLAASGAIPPAGPWSDRVAAHVPSVPVSD
jgi:hypothetical protein